MKAILLIGVFPFILIPSLTSASDEEFLMTTYGQGNESCGSFLSSVTDTSSPELESYFSQWTAGYLSGVQFERKDHIDTDLKAAHYWLVEYCKKHPLNGYLQANVQLVRALTLEKQ